MRTGVDAHIGFTHIADFALNGSGGQVNNNFVTDLVIGIFSGATSTSSFCCCSYSSRIWGKLSLRKMGCPLLVKSISCKLTDLNMKLTWSTRKFRSSSLIMLPIGR